MADDPQPTRPSLVDRLIVETLDAAAVRVLSACQMCRGAGVHQFWTVDPQIGKRYKATEVCSHESVQADVLLDAIPDLVRSAVAAADAELEACRQALAVQVARANNAEAAVEQMRAARFAPRPTVFPSDLMPGRWMVRCDACRAGDLMCPTEAVATGFAERHVHVYPDGEGFIRGEGWPE